MNQILLVIVIPLLALAISIVLVLLVWELFRIINSWRQVKTDECRFKYKRRHFRRRR